MNIRNNTFLSLVLVAFSGMFFACENAEHYAEKGQSQTSLMGLISARPELSGFAALLRQTGYDAVLDGDQVYTVWAPDNGALVGAGVDLSDATEVANLVSNHIARFSVSASGSEERKVSMVNNKPLTFYREGDNYYLKVPSEPAGVLLTAQNIPARNGLLHILGQNMPLVRNVWQYMAQPGFEPIADYLYSFNRRMFSENQSSQIDVNDDGIVYDSVFIESNEMFYPFRGIGYLNHEDSIYSMVMPTKTAWEEAYARVAPYFLSNDPVDPDSVQRENTNYALVKDLVFRGDISRESFSASDTIFSTRGAAIADPNHLFSGGKWEEASNGKVYVTDRLNYKAWEAWQQPIKIEAERVMGRYFNSNGDNLGTLFHFWDPNNKDLSNGAYIVVSATSPRNYPSVTFDIPNTVAGKYDIYCRLVPGTPPTKERSRIVYEIYKWNKGTDITKYTPGLAGESWRLLGNNDATGSSWNVQPEDPDSWEGIYRGAARADTVTNMLLVKNFQFKHANFNEENTSIRIRIKSYVPDAWIENGTFRNVMRIDCITLEPVRE